ncbi:hypothetical protein [Hyphococcus sp.]|uniref:hypothetical protein n=1 Tax=Hyphococcus sp. TaxID=2038636 RepID=UPI0035C6647E
MTSLNLRSDLRKALGFVSNPKFERREPRDNDFDSFLSLIANLHKENSDFFSTYDYEWTLKRDSYNSPIEAYYQFRILNVLSTLPLDQLAEQQCEDIVVRIVPRARSRAYARKVGKYRVIATTTGHTVSLELFISLWLKGTSLGYSISGNAPKNYNDAAANFMIALRSAEEKMVNSVNVYVAYLLTLLDNEVPSAAASNIFADKELFVPGWQSEMEQRENLWASAEGFVLFHELAHVMSGHIESSSERSNALEVDVDSVGLQLSEVDNSRHGGSAATLGACIFFFNEMLLTLYEEAVEANLGNYDPEGESHQSVFELMLRTCHHKKYFEADSNSPGLIPCKEAYHAMSMVFASVKWFAMSRWGSESSLYEFVLREST